MKQLLVYLLEKTLQERQQALFLEFHSKGITRLLIVVFICCISEGKESCLSIRSICVARDYPDAFPQSNVNSCTTLVEIARASSDQLVYALAIHLMLLLR